MKVVCLHLLKFIVEILIKILISIFLTLVMVTTIVNLFYEIKVLFIVMIVLFLCFLLGFSIQKIIFILKKDKNLSSNIISSFLTLISFVIIFSTFLISLS